MAEFVVVVLNHDQSASLGHGEQKHCSKGQDPDDERPTTEAPSLPEHEQHPGSFLLFHFP